MVMDAVKREIREALDQASRTLIMPGYISEIETLVSDPKASARDLCDIIDREDRLSRIVINSANSPFYGIPRKAVDTVQAVKAIGFKEVTAIARCAAVYTLFARDRSSLGEKIIAHGSQVGSAAIMLSMHIKAKYSAGTFLAGLVHDIGKAIESMFMQERFEKFMQVLNDEDNLLGYHRLEGISFGISHAELGAEFLECSGFPKDITETVSCHHAAFPEGEDKLLSSIIHTADIICNIKGLTPFKGTTFPLVEKGMILPLQGMKKDFGSKDMVSLAERVEIEMERLRPFIAAMR